MSLQHLLVFAPTRRAASETFVRANLEGLPFAVKAYFGDERPWGQPDRLAYGLSVLLSKVCTRLGLLRLAGWPAAVVAQMLIARHRPDVVLAEFGFHAVRVMEATHSLGVPLVVHFRGSDLSAAGKLGGEATSLKYFQKKVGDNVKIDSKPAMSTYGHKSAEDKLVKRMRKDLGGSPNDMRDPDVETDEDKLAQARSKLKQDLSSSRSRPTYR